MLFSGYQLICFQTVCYLLTSGQEQACANYSLSLFSNSLFLMGNHWGGRGDDTSSIMNLESYLRDPLGDQIRFDYSVVWVNMLRGTAPRGQQTVFLVRLTAICKFCNSAKETAKSALPEIRLGVSIATANLHSCTG